MFCGIQSSCCVYSTDDSIWITSRTLARIHINTQLFSPKVKDVVLCNDTPNWCKKIPFGFLQIVKNTQIRYKTKHICLNKVPQYTKKIGFKTTMGQEQVVLVVHMQISCLRNLKQNENSRDFLIFSDPT